MFECDGEPACSALQYGRLEVPAREGVAFPLVKKLLECDAAREQCSARAEAS